MLKRDLIRYRPSSIPHHLHFCHILHGEYCNVPTVIARGRSCQCARRPTIGGQNLSPVNLVPVSKDGYCARRQLTRDEVHIRPHLLTSTYDKVGKVLQVCARKCSSQYPCLGLLVSTNKITSTYHLAPQVSAISFAFPIHGIMKQDDFSRIFLLKIEHNPGLPRSAHGSRGSIVQMIYK